MPNMNTGIKKFLVRSIKIYSRLQHVQTSWWLNSVALYLANWNSLALHLHEALLCVKLVRLIANVNVHLLVKHQTILLTENRVTIHVFPKKYKGINTNHYGS